MKFRWNSESDKLISKGLSKEKIAEKLAISTSQVYQRMSYLARKGKGFSGVLLGKQMSAGKKAAITRQANRVIKDFIVPDLPKPYTSFKYTINGTSIFIEGNAKEVFVNKDHIKVNY